MFARKTRHRSFIAITILFFSFLFLSQNYIKPTNIKVLLEEKGSVNKSHFQIKSNSGITIEDLTNNKKVLFKKNKLDIFIKNNEIYLPYTDKHIKKIKTNKIKLTPTSGPILFNNKTYDGDLTFDVDPSKNTLYAINSLNLDNYIYSVLISESYQTWPLEMQKVQAIVSRTYAIHHMKQAETKKDKKPYDIKRSNFNQTYNGLHEYTHLWQAITDTHNLVLTYDNKPVLAMFDACCGGIVTANMKSLDFNKAPYLARKQKCNFCKNYSLFKWHKEFLVNNFISELKANPKISKEFGTPRSLGAFRNIRIIEKDKAGIVHKIKLIFAKKVITISGNQLWDSMKNKVRSLNFNIKKQGNKILIDGHGFGHQVGLCQRGARELVRKGWNFRKILNFYYPGTKLSRLNA